MHLICLQNDKGLRFKVPSLDSSLRICSLMGHGSNANQTCVYDSKTVDAVSYMLQPYVSALKCILEYSSISVEQEEFALCNFFKSQENCMFKACTSIYFAYFRKTIITISNKVTKEERNKIKWNKLN